MSSSKQVYIQDASKHDGQEVTLRGWVYNKRASGKKLRFLILRDGTGLMQGVLFKGECEEEALAVFDELTQESAIEVTGVLRKEDRSVGGYELGVRKIRPIHIAEEYPISPKEHGIEFLMQNRHLWVRSQKQWAALRIRSHLMLQIHEFFQNKGFVLFDPPILTPNSCEGTSTLFTTPYFDEKAYLTQSGQLYAEVGAMAFGKVYTCGPTFRAEKSKTRKHLTEFWMVEPEVAFADLQENMDLGEQFVQHLIQSTLQNCSQELEILERNRENLEKVVSPFPRITYDEAVERLARTDHPLKWGDDFGAPHEAALLEQFDKPVFVYNMPAEIKAFYFKRTEDEKYALGCDLIAPEGYGEIIGGGQREERYDVLKQRIEEHQLPLEDYQWYLDLRRFGTNPHSGFGLGVERTVAWVTGVTHVRETIPFPRTINTLRP